VVLLLYKRAFEQTDMGMASAMAWFLFLVLGVMTIINFAASKKWVFYGGDAICEKHTNCLWGALLSGCSFS
jgi:hypothetical protein